MIGIISSKDQEIDFNFDLPCYKNEEKIGHCVFKLSMMKNETLAMINFPIDGSSDNYIIFKIFWVKPYKNTLTKAKTISYPKFFTIGHRGSGENAVSKEYYENSLVSFQAAEKNGVDFVEFDIQMSKNGVPVIFHDFNIESRELIKQFHEPVGKSNNGN